MLDTGAIEEKRADVLELQANVARLRRRQVDLEETIDTLAAEVKRGSLPGSVKLNSTAIEKSQVDAELAKAEKALAAAEAELRPLAERQRVESLKSALAEVEAANAEVIALVRSAAVELGRRHDLLKRINELVRQGNAPVGDGAFGCWPHEVSALREAQPLPDPYRGWDSSVEYLPVDFDAGTIRVKPVRAFSS